MLGGASPKMEQSHLLLTSTIYTACPLDPSKSEIRLLKVELEHGPGRALRCAFRKASLEEHGPPFTAVSYAWGQGEHDRLIYVGMEAIKVTKTVDNVLRGVLADGATFLWLDQICIDQANTMERSNQVSMMSVIYSRADRVLVYLGEAGEHTSVAIDFAEHYHWRMMDQGTSETRIAQMSSSESVSFIASREHSDSSDTEVLRRIALGLVDLLTRQFFQRLWVVQEVVLGRDLVTVCGPRHFQWYILRLACLLFTRRPELASLLKSFVDTNCDFATMRKASRLVKQQGGQARRDLWDILNDYSGLVTCEPRDKIYAILGLARRTIDLPKPDYAKPLKEVYLEFARHFVQVGHGIELIEAAVASNRQRPTGYPSWAPWFQDMETDKRRWKTTGMKAAGNTAPVIKLGYYISDIVVQGALVDTVCDIGPPGPKREEKLRDPNVEHEIFLEWIEKSLKMLEASVIELPAASLASVCSRSRPR